MTKLAIKALCSLMLLGLVSCEAEEEKSTTPETPKETIVGDFECEKHWTAFDGINETNYWYELNFTAVGFIYKYKFKNYFTGQGWTFSEDWDDWVWTAYEYEIDGTKIRMRLTTIPKGDWSEWTEYILTDTSLTITIEGIEREYFKK